MKIEKKWKFKNKCWRKNENLKIHVEKNENWKKTKLKNLSWKY